MPVTDEQRRLASEKAAAIEVRYGSGDKIHAMPWTRDQMTNEELQQWVASREEAGRTIDIGTCELGCWYCFDQDPYGADYVPEAGVGRNHFVRSPESRGWVHECDLPDDVRVAMEERMDIERALFSAAAEKHPGWDVTRTGGPTKIDNEAPEYFGLIEWFRNSFPRESRVIKAAIREKRVADALLADDFEVPF